MYKYNEINIICINTMKLRTIEINNQNKTKVCSMMQGRRGGGIGARVSVNFIRDCQYFAVIFMKRNAYINSTIERR